MPHDREPLRLPSEERRRRWDDGDSGSLSPAERIERIENVVNQHEKEDREMFARIFHKIEDIRVDLARTSTRVALIVGLVSVVGTAIIELLFRMVKP